MFRIALAAALLYRSVLAELPPAGPETQCLGPLANVAKTASLSLGSVRAKLVKRKSDYPGYTRVEITLNDTYGLDLAQEHGWSEPQVQNIEVQLFAKLSRLRPIIQHEDKELLYVDFPTDKQSDRVREVREALEAAVRSPIDTAEMERQKPLLSAHRSEASAILTAHRKSKRDDQTLVRAYTHGYKAGEKNMGYCVIARTKIGKLEGLTLSETEFLSADRKLATKKGVVILDVSLAGTAFERVYGDKVIPQDKLWGGYESELLKLVQELPEAKQGLLKHQGKALTVDGRGEALKLVVTEALAEQVAAKMRDLFSDFNQAAD